MAVCQA